MKKGYIIPNGVAMETHENKTVVFLTELGFVVELVPSRPTIRQSKTPDAIINGKEWEIKSPKKNGKYTIEHMLQSAEKQSPNVIIDLRRNTAPVRSLAKIKHRAGLRNKLKNVVVITKDGRIIDIKGSL